MPHELFSSAAEMNGRRSNPKRGEFARDDESDDFLTENF
jgi:hypothetical protein